MPCLSSLNSQFLFIRIICRKIRNEFAKALLLGVLANLNCPSITLAKKKGRGIDRGGRQGEALIRDIDARVFYYLSITFHRLDAEICKPSIFEPAHCILFVTVVCF